MDALVTPIAGLFILVLSLGLGWFILKLILSVIGTIGWSLSGETGSILPRGFGTGGWRLRRAAELQKIVGQVALTMRLNLPLAAALRAAAAGESRRISTALNYIAHLLSVGCPLHEAFRLAVKGCPPLLLGMVRKAEQCGQVTQALTNIERMLADRLRQRAPNRSPQVVLYAVLMLAICLAMVTFIMVLVVPKFKDIFMDYDAELPPLTQGLIGLMDWLVVDLHAFVVIPILFILAVVVAFMAIGVRSSETPGRMARAIAAVRWAIPFTRTIDHGFGMAAAIRTMATAMQAGVPLDKAIKQALTIDATNHLRVRLDHFADEVRAGQTPHAAAEAANLGGVFVSALTMVQRGESPQRAMTHAADYYEAIAYRWWHALTAVGPPLVTLAAACMVGFVAFALFLPMIQLIDSVSGW